MLKKVKEKINVAEIRTRIKQKVSNLTVRRALLDQKGSGLVEYIAIGAMALVVIVVVVIPGLNTFFGTDVFPGLSGAVKKIFNYT